MKKNPWVGASTEGMHEDGGVKHRAEEHAKAQAPFLAIQAIQRRPSKRRSVRGKKTELYWTAERRALLVALYDDGATYEDIAGMVGISRERVRQLVYKGKTRGPGWVHGNEPLAVMQVHREHPDWPMTLIAKHTGIACDRVRRHVRALGVREEFSTHRRPAWTDDELLALLRIHAWRSSRWWLENAKQYGYPAVATYLTVFGSWNSARRAAGLPICKPGGSFAHAMHLWEGRR